MENTDSSPDNSSESFKPKWREPLNRALARVSGRALSRKPVIESERPEASPVFQAAGSLLEEFGQPILQVDPEKGGDTKTIQGFSLNLDALNHQKREELRALRIDMSDGRQLGLAGLEISSSGEGMFDVRIATTTTLEALERNGASGLSDKMNLEMTFGRDGKFGRRTTINSDPYSVDVSEAQRISGETLSELLASVHSVLSSPEQ